MHTRIFPTARKIVPWHSNPVEDTLTKKEIISICTDNAVSKVNTHSQDDGSSDDFDLCRVARQATIPAHMKAAVLVSCQGVGIMMIEAHGSVDEPRCPVTACGIMYILPGKLCPVYIENLTARNVSLLKCMIVANVSIAPTCIIHVREDEPTMMKKEGHVSTQWDSKSTDPTINAVRYKLQERPTEEVGCTKRGKRAERKFLDRLAKGARDTRPIFRVSRQIYKHAQTIRGHVGKPLRVN